MNNPPVGPLGVLGKPEVGSTIIARPNAVYDLDGIDQESVHFQWMSNGNPINGATSQSYTVREEDRGSSLSVVYTYTDRKGTTESVESRALEVEDPIEKAIRAIYFLTFNREPDISGAHFYTTHYKNGVDLSFLVKDMEENKKNGAT